MRRIIILGPPGGGKGTQAQFIANKYNIPHISTGNMLRFIASEKTELSNKIKETIDNGKLISDELITTLVKKRIENEDCCDGFLLDGFPRTMGQIYAIKNMGVNINYVLELVVPDQVIMNRIIGRRVHINSGRIYHILFNPPKQDNIDDVTGEPLVIRKDDQEDTLQKRLTEYHQQIIPLSNYFAIQAKIGCLRYVKIDGTCNIIDIQSQIINFLNY